MLYFSTGDSRNGSSGDDNSSPMRVPQLSGLTEDALVKIARQKLAVEQERLATEKERLSKEKAQLNIDRKILLIKEGKYQLYMKR